YNYIYRSKFNFFSTTFFRPSGDTPAISLPLMQYNVFCIQLHLLEALLPVIECNQTIIHEVKRPLVRSKLHTNGQMYQDLIRIE
ncbi:hypothetical protein L9F63_005048, partial [Diploptera punctata]